MKCANCEDNAFYIYQLTATSQILYCAKHLPKFLLQAKKAGLLKTTDALQSAIEEGLKNITTPVVETPVVEDEPVVEETPDTKPKKKATSKKKAE